MNTFLKVLVVSGLCTAAHAALAATIDVSVSARSGPYDQSANPTMPYDTGALAPTTVTGSLIAGSSYTIAYVSGETRTVSFYGPTDGKGYSNVKAGIGYPSQYIPNADAYLEELIGAFADSSGKVLSLFVVGDGGTFVAPTGASEILLGINDNHYADNLGALTVSVNGPGISSVPLPSAAPLFGAALVAFGVAGIGWRRKSTAATA